jgi:predicted MFS family arabinose efflux permease
MLNQNLNSELSPLHKNLLLIDFLLRVIGLASFTIFAAAVYDLEKNTYYLGLTACFMALPSLLVVQLIGRVLLIVTADQLFFWTNLARAMSFLILAILDLGLYGIIAVAALGSFFHQIISATKMEMDAQVLDDNSRTNFLTTKSGLSSVSIIIGPPLGGLLFSQGSFPMALIVIGLTTLFILMLFKSQYSEFKKITMDQFSKVNGGDAIGIVKTYRHLISKPYLFSVVFSYCLVAILLEIQAPLIFPFVSEVYSLGSDHASYLLGLGGIGGITGAIIAKKYPDIINAKYIPWLLVFDGIVFGAFCLTSEILIGALLFCFLGIIGAISLIIVEAVVQTQSTQEYRASIFSLLQFAAGAGGAAISVGAGILAYKIGTQSVLLYSAYFEILVGLLIFLFLFSEFKFFLGEKNK